MDLPSLLADETLRRKEFPVCADRIFLSHAAVAPLPRRVAHALIDFAQASMTAGPDEYVAGLKDIDDTRLAAARLIGASPHEIALLGPTSLGLSLFAAGLDWAPGDEVLYYGDDYPANVYPWTDLARRGVVPHALPSPARPGEITPELVASALTPRTRLVALASAFFLNGYRIDLDAIGQLLHERGILFSVDAIQTLGAAPLSVEHIDFLSADAHKWLLGPVAAGIVYVKKEHFGRLRPALLGASNVRSPDFIAQDEIVFLNTAARYEPGVLNIGPILGMKASLEMFLEIGPAQIAGRIAGLVRHLAEGLQGMGFEPLGPIEGPNASGILTVSHPRAEAGQMYRALQARRVTASLRRDRAGKSFLRFSPHFYNTGSELDQALSILRKSV
jgi:cysteine desulfurase/selenocysteine lyase